MRFLAHFLALILAAFVLDSVCGVSEIIEVGHAVKGEPNKCHYHTKDKVMEVGKEYPSKDKCAATKCSRDFKIVKLTCDLPKKATGSCRIKEDKSKPYPECCPKLVC